MDIDKKGIAFGIVLAIVGVLSTLRLWADSKSRFLLFLGVAFFNILIIALVKMIRFEQEFWRRLTYSCTLGTFVSSIVGAVAWHSEKNVLAAIVIGIVGFLVSTLVAYWRNPKTPAFGELD